MNKMGKEQKPAHPLGVPVQKWSFTGRGRLEPEFPPAGDVPSPPSTGLLWGGFLGCSLADVHTLNSFCSYDEHQNPSLGERSWTLKIFVGPHKNCCCYWGFLFFLLRKTLEVGIFDTLTLCASLITGLLHTSTFSPFSFLAERDADALVAWLHTTCFEHMTASLENPVGIWT